MEIKSLEIIRLDKTLDDELQNCNSFAFKFKAIVVFKNNKKRLFQLGRKIHYLDNIFIKNDEAIKIAEDTLNRTLQNGYIVSGENLDKKIYFKSIMPI